MIELAGIGPRITIPVRITVTDSKSNTRIERLDQLSITIEDDEHFKDQPIIRGCIRNGSLIETRITRNV